jgi:ubiquinone/menaquinone biosynthesis C-methylase UbiE
MIKNNNEYWNNFYKKFNTCEESNFARFVYKYISKLKNVKLLDVACGNGRDTFYFRKNAIDAEGVDISRTAIKKNKLISDFFYIKNVCKKKIFFKKKYNVIYARFFLHAINEKQENIFFKNLKKIATKNSKIFLEFRTDKDPLINKGIKISKNERFYTHYRRFINVSNFKVKVLKNKFKVIKIISSSNFALFKGQKPNICRAILLLK